MYLIHRLPLIFILILSITLSTSALQTGSKSNKSQLQGSVEITGSGTLYPLTKAVADFFENMYPGVDVNVEATGTVKGFSIFTEGVSDITNASRPISPDEIQKLNEQGIEIYEMPVTYGAITLIRNNNNDFAGDLTPEEVKLIFKKNSPITTWNDLRPAWPDKEIIVTGPKSTHGTYDFFQTKILGKDAPFRQNYNSFQEYEEVISTVEKNLYAIGYVGLANYTNHKGQVGTVALNFGGEVVEPSFINVKHERYKVLSRKMYIYVNAKSISKPTVNRFIDVYLSSANLYSSKIGFIPFNEQHYKQLWQRVQQGQTGLFAERSPGRSSR